MLERDERVNLYYTNNTDDLLKADIILLPGTKSTLDDLYELRRNGVAQAILRAHREGTMVMGICGGYQMMGREICDPEGVEGSLTRLPGLGLLPMQTVMQKEKVTRQVRFTLAGATGAGQGYEIHNGTTLPVEGETYTPFTRLEDGTPEGSMSGSRCVGTYIHGILDNPSVIDWLVAPYAGKKAVSSPDYAAYKEEQYNKLADHVRSHLNMPLIYQILTAHD